MLSRESGIIGFALYRLYGSLRMIVEHFCLSTSKDNCHSSANFSIIERFAFLMSEILLTRELNWVLNHLCKKHGLS